MSEHREDENLQRALGAMLHHRAESIESAPLIDLGSAQPERRGRRPVLIAGAVAATVVAALTLTSVLLTRLGSSTSAPSTPSAPLASTASAPSVSGPASSPTAITMSRQTCSVSAGALSAALTAHRLSVDQPINTPVASGPGGAFVMQQQRMDASGRHDNELAYFAADGHGTTMWTDQDPHVDTGDYNVAVDPNAAASKDWVVFSPSVVDPAGSKHLTNAIKAWNVHTHQLRTLPHQDDAGGLGLSPFAPIVIADIAYWIEYPTANTHRQLLIGWNLATGRVASSQQVSDVVALLRLGDEVALVLEDGTADESTARIAAAPGRTIPAAVARAGIGAIDANVDVTTDNSGGTTVRWAVRNGVNSVQVRTWVIGSSTVSSTTITATRSAVPRVYAWPLVLFSDQRTVVNMSNGRVSSLPSSAYIDLATGNDAIVTTPTTSRSNSVSRVPVAQLAALLC
jgi:hypothetical protein